MTKFEKKYSRMMDAVSPEPGLREKVLARVPGRKQRRVLRPALILSAVVFCMVCAVPVLATTYEPFQRALYALFPETAQYFKPVQLSCEDNGIRMEVISSYIHGDTAEIYLAMTDLTGNRIDATMDLYDSYTISRGFDSAATCRQVSFDQEKNQATFLITITQWNDKQIEGEKITFSLKRFLSGKQEHNLVPIPFSLQPEEEVRTQEVELRGGGGQEFEQYIGVSCQRAAALVPSEPREDFPIEGIELTGMAYLDGTLHIQTAVRDPLSNDNHGYFTLKTASGEELTYHYSISFTNGLEGSQRVDYTEYLFLLPRQELEGAELFGTFVTCDSLTEGDWSVTFPLEKAE